MVALPEKLIKMNPYDPSEEKFRIKLDANESFILLSNGKKEKIAQQIMKLDFNRYPDPSALKIRNLAGKMLGVSSDCIAAGNGSDELISVLVNSFCTKGEKLMVLEPDFSMYQFYAGLCEVSVVSCNKNGEFSISTDEIINKARIEKPQMFIFSNPCNPTGRGFSKAEVLKIANELPDTLIIADEAYMEFWNESILKECTAFNNLLVLKTMSKAFGMAAIRLGFVIGNPQLIEQINKARSPYNVNALTQTVSEIILEDIKSLKRQTTLIVENKLELEQEFIVLSQKYALISVIPSCTNFVVIKTKFCKKIYQRLLEKSIAVRLFAKYGFLRITTGSKEENSELLKEFEAVLKEGF